MLGHCRRCVEIFGLGNRYYRVTSFVLIFFSSFSFVSHLKAFGSLIRLRCIQLYSINSIFCVCLSFLQSTRIEPMSAESFLDQYSLPRIARLMAQKKSNTDDQQQKNSKKVVQSTTAPLNETTTNCSDEFKSTSPDSNNNCGELFLLYRHLKNYKVYHAVNAKSSSNSRKKGIKIPQDFTGELKNVNNETKRRKFFLILMKSQNPQRFTHIFLVSQKHFFEEIE